MERGAEVGPRPGQHPGRRQFPRTIQLPALTFGESQEVLRVPRRCGRGIAGRLQRDSGEAAQRIEETEWLRVLVLGDDHRRIDETCQ
ncbi:MAG: hypothetical protein QM733_19480 [Ilumatobacteraceae bacterium]